MSSWALKRAKNSEAVLLSPFTLLAGPSPGLPSLLEGTAEGKNRARPWKPSQARQSAARTAPPLGALLWEVSRVGFQSIPAAGSVAAPTPAVAEFRPAARACSSDSGRRRGHRACPARVLRGRGRSLPASGRGRSPRSPSPPARPRLNAAAASPRSSCLAVPT